MILTPKHRYRLHRYINQSHYKSSPHASDDLAALISQAKRLVEFEWAGWQITDTTTGSVVIGGLTALAEDPEPGRARPARLFLYRIAESVAEQVTCKTARASARAAMAALRE